MDKVFMIAMMPMMIGSVLYLAQAAGYYWMLDRPGLAWAIFCYSASNLGFLYDAWSMMERT